MALVDIVDVVFVLDGGMAAVGTVGVLVRLGGGVHIAEGALVVVVGVAVVRVSVVEVVDVVVVRHGGVAAVGGVGVVVPGVRAVFGCGGQGDPSSRLCVMASRTMCATCSSRSA